MTYYDEDEYDCGDYCGGAIGLSDISRYLTDACRLDPQTDFVKGYDKGIRLLNRFLYFILFIMLIVQIIAAAIPLILSCIAFFKSWKAEKKVKENKETIESFKELHGKSKY